MQMNYNNGLEKSVRGSFSFRQWKAERLNCEKVPLEEGGVIEKLPLSVAFGLSTNVLKPDGSRFGTWIPPVSIIFRGATQKNLQRNEKEIPNKRKRNPRFSAERPHLGLWKRQVSIQRLVNMLPQPLTMLGQCVCRQLPSGQPKRRAYRYMWTKRVERSISKLASSRRTALVKEF